MTSENQQIEASSTLNLWTKEISRTTFDQAVRLLGRREEVVREPGLKGISGTEFNCLAMPLQLFDELGAEAIEFLCTVSSNVLQASTYVYIKRNGSSTIAGNVEIEVR